MAPYERINSLPLKKKHNKSLVRLSRQWAMERQLCVKSLTCAVIDTSDAHSTRALVNWGINPENILMVNKNKLDTDGFRLLYPKANTFTGLFTGAIKLGFSFNLIYYDCCSNIQTSHPDIYNIFAKGIISEGILMVTLSNRTNTKLDAERFFNGLQGKYKLPDFWCDDESDSWSAYITDQLIKDYGSRFGYVVERNVTCEIPFAQYKKMFIVCSILLLVPSLQLKN
jgi:hypothetical protein